VKIMNIQGLVIGNSGRRVAVDETLKGKRSRDQAHRHMVDALPSSFSFIDLSSAPSLVIRQACETLARFQLAP